MGLLRSRNQDSIRNTEDLLGGREQEKVRGPSDRNVDSEREGRRDVQEVSDCSTVPRKV